MPTATQITFTPLDLSGACCQALFSSGLQPSDAPTAREDQRSSDTCLASVVLRWSGRSVGAWDPA